MTARSAKATCDKYFSRVVRARGHCEYPGCAVTEPLEAAHVIRRRYLGDPDGIPLRHNEDNAWALCGQHHREVDLDPVAFAQLVSVTLGEAKYAELLAVRNARHRPWRESDWCRERARLLGLLKAAA